MVNNFSEDNVVKTFYPGECNETVGGRSHAADETRQDPIFKRDVFAPPVYCSAQRCNPNSNPRSVSITPPHSGDSQGRLCAGLDIV